MKLCKQQIYTNWGKKDTYKLSQLLTECFSQDPLYYQLIPEKEIRKEILPEIFNCDLDEIFQTCEVYADSKDVAGELCGFGRNGAL